MEEFTYNDILSKEMAPAILSYKYSGQDLSIMYKHINSPLAQYVLDKYVPRTIA